MSDKPFSRLQALWLEELEKGGDIVGIRLVNGIALRGRVIGNDDYTVLIENQNEQASHDPEEPHRQHLRRPQNPADRSAPTKVLAVTVAVPDGAWQRLDGR
ncbi:RNA chaperone Hfq [Acidithiobacillus sp.]|uniref:RNA chaperone Hfq n=1 Tax=Acidithiobacillus sp. TaxID=1872118 RepID=UPI003D0161A3